MNAMMREGCDPSRDDWIEEFEAAAKRPLETRFRYAFIRTYKPVLDDERHRAFDSLAAYRGWCEANLCPDTTQDADLFVDKTPANGRALATALTELGFALTSAQAMDIERGRDFVQLKNGPFDLDLVFAPGGIERFEDAWARRVDVEGFPVC